MLLEFWDLVAGRELREVPAAKGVRSYDSGPRLLPQPLQPGGTINVSWGAQASGGGSYDDVWLSVEVNGQWSPFFLIGRWTESNTRRIARTSFSDKLPAFGEISVDTYENTLNVPVTGWRVRVDCVGRSDLFWVSVQAADKQTWCCVSAPYLSESVHLDMPVISQYSIRGGKIHCGPVSAHGILDGFGVAPSGGVQEVIRSTVDQAYIGGNWAFLAAYMSTRLRPLGLRAFIQNVNSVRDIELYLHDGYPVIASLAWDNNDPAKRLRGGIPKTDGHLMPVVGVNGQWVLVMDPATTRKDRSDVARHYRRNQFERRLIESSNGTIIAVSELPV